MFLSNAPYKVETKGHRPKGCLLYRRTVVVHTFNLQEKTT